MVQKFNLVDTTLLTTSLSTIVLVDDKQEALVEQYLKCRHIHTSDTHRNAHPLLFGDIMIALQHT